MTLHRGEGGGGGLELVPYRRPSTFHFQAPHSPSLENSRPPISKFRITYPSWKPSNQPGSRVGGGVRCCDAKADVAETTIYTGWLPSRYFVDHVGIIMKVNSCNDSCMSEPFTDYIVESLREDVKLTKEKYFSWIVLGTVLIKLAQTSDKRDEFNVICSWEIIKMSNVKKIIIKRKEQNVAKSLRTIVVKMQFACYEA